MIDPKKSIVFGLAAALMITTSVSAYAVPDDGTRPIPVTTGKPDPAAKGPDTDAVGEDVGALDIDDAEDDDDIEDEDGDDDEDDDDLADEDGDDEDSDEDDVAEDDDDDTDEDGEDVAEDDGEDEDGDEEEVAEVDEQIGGPDALEQGGVYEVVAMTDCKSRYCGKLVLSDETGNVVYSTVNNFDPEFEASLAPHEVTFASVHVGCKLRGYFEPVEGADGEERNGFYVQEFM